jgi:hypothetical protein
MALYTYVGPHRLENGYASKFEETLGKQLDGLEVDYQYEPYTIDYVVPARKAKYKPDFLLPTGILIEAKGWSMETEDRQKMILVRDQHPELDIRFVFEKPNGKIYPKSKTTYAKWAEDHGFIWAEKRIPKEWLK